MSGFLDLTTYPVKSFSLTGHEKKAVSYSQSGARFSRIIGAHLWKISIEIDQMERAQYQGLMSFLTQNNADQDVFQVNYPNHQDPLGTISQAPVKTITAGSSSLGDNTIEIENVGTGETVLAGDIFTITGDDKVYMCVQDTIEDEGFADPGEMRITFVPKLRIQPTTGTSVLFHNRWFTVALDTNKIGYKATNKNASFSFDVIEALV